MIAALAGRLGQCDGLLLLPESVSSFRRTGKMYFEAFKSPVQHLFINLDAFQAYTVVYGGVLNSQRSKTVTGAFSRLFLQTYVLLKIVIPDGEK
jgi:hypothetical protein